MKVVQILIINIIIVVVIDIEIGNNIFSINIISSIIQ